MKSRPVSSAFTLVELLVVLAIIAILAGLLIPTISKMTANANATKCASNLVQLGTAINAYTADNDGYLPGPLSIAQYPLLGAGVTDDQQLFKRLAKYLGLDDSGNATSDSQQRGNILICPAYQKAIPKLNGASYVLNPRIVPGPEQPVFGDPASGANPLKKSLLSTWTDTPTATDAGGGNSAPAPVDLTRTWAIKDADQQAFSGIKVTVAVDGTSAMATTPVHGDFRNALFFDWHVGRLSAVVSTNDQVK